ncbi:hypothetical protein AN639_02525 [Candidatus Epulonipiscium fishelsonii]|uniref:Uncharacterized protein n=1 Tax=Candidatus Epulonipiscium fishelsonii TaxID=77094 RepID=A0ACC8XAV2_9FIRM|nr:hypothetical protein AN396_07765 [Epulopiscium sp. SCG-B11WGA-EpuloA1]ONI42002.1 hypothetical protein AN639_02525 [Epulopiscium sp. SCG-B05WGA-EpuloA1]
MEKINIMTSCNENLVTYIFVQLKSINVHLNDKQVDFYLFYHDISEDSLNTLEKYSSYLGNINFIRIYIENIEPYKEIINLSVGSWPVETYFSLECQKYLPETIDRILYIDAGDVIFCKSIDEYYNHDFFDKYLIGTPIVYNTNKEDLLFYPEDLMDYDQVQKILFRGIFNSGSYLINLKKFRQKNISLTDYLEVFYNLRKRFPDKKIIFFGDQGILSLLFIGEITYIKISPSENIHLFYMPYNCMIGLDPKISELTGTPKILHFIKKPWKYPVGIFESEEIFYNYWHVLNRIVCLELSLMCNSNQKPPSYG